MYGCTRVVLIWSTTGDITNSVRNSDRPISTWFGGRLAGAERLPQDGQHDHDAREGRHHQQDGRQQRDRRHQRQHLERRCSALGSDPFAGWHHIGQADSELVIDDDDLAVRHEGAIHQYVERFARATVQLNHRTLREPQQPADAHLRASDFQRQRDRDIEDDVDVRSRVIA
jgi:hypothetical protein